MWYYNTINPFSFPINISFQKLTLSGDTIINGELFDKIISESKETLSNSSGNNIEYIRMDASQEKVLWYNREQNKVTTLYDFLANEGDSWEISVANCNFMVTVDSVSFETINGQQMKVQFISDEKNYFTGKVIKSIGNTVSFFPRDIYNICKYNANFDGQAIHGLRCFENEDLSFHFVDYACDTTYTYLGAEYNENNHQSMVKLYPNPFSNILNIDFTGNYFPTNAHLNIYDVKGGIVYSSNIYNNSAIELSHLKHGMYYVVINSKNKKPILLKTFKI